MKKMLLVILGVVTILLTGCGSTEPVDRYHEYDRRGRYQTMEDINDHLLSHEIVDLQDLDDMQSRVVDIQAHFQELYGQSYDDAGVSYQIARFYENYKIIRRLRLEGK